MITEKGTLIIGIEFNGKNHTNFELRPQLVRDSIEAVEDDERARENEIYLGLAVLTKQIVSLGDIPKEKITAPLLMDLHATDMAIIKEALGRLERRLQSFREKISDQNISKDNTGPA